MKKCLKHCFFDHSNLFRISCFVLRIFAAAGMLFLPAALHAAAPNILLLISDDHSSFSLGCYGSSVRTPNLDKLAAGGVRFTNAFVASPQCSPSRSAVLTGRWPHQTNTSRLHIPLREEFPTIIDRLKSAGFHTGGFKKHHLGPPLRERFDFYRNDKNWSAFFEQRPKDKPFFLWVGFTDPHRDYKPGAATPPHDPNDVKVPPFLPDTPEVRGDVALYYDAITRMDADAGDVLALLDKHGLAENTLVFFFGDNGMPFPGAKATLFDPGIRVPLIARWPAGSVKGGRVVESLVSLIDLLPTCLEAGGLDAKPDAEGVSLKPLLTGKGSSVRNEIFAERNWHDGFDPTRCIRTERFKLIYYCRPEMPYRPITDLARSPTWQSILALREERKLSPEMEEHFFQSPRPTFALYDLKADPNEMTNLADDPAHAATRRDLEARLTKWMDETNDFLPSPAAAHRSAHRNDNEPAAATTRKR
jgi:arylsulfatase A-like enzyme